MMPLDLALHERDTAPLASVREEAARPARLHRQTRETRHQCTDVVPVHLTDAPTECAPAIGKRLEADGVLRGVTLLQAVPIDDDGEVVEVVLGCEHRRL